jgi:hypothetical protein
MLINYNIQLQAGKAYIASSRLVVEEAPADDSSVCPNAYSIQLGQKYVLDFFI